LNVHLRADAKSFRCFGKVGRLRSLGRQSLLKHKKGEQRGKQDGGSFTCIKLFLIGVYCLRRHFARPHLAQKLMRQQHGHG
jgi:hypothetical protein